MVQELLMAIHKQRKWLDRFNKKQYARASEEYTAAFGPLYTAAVQQAEDDDALRALAEELLDALEAAWAKTFRWGRKALEYDDKLMIILYLSPMLQMLEEPRCGDFARTLQAAWAARWPENDYELTSFDALLDGFRNVILGIEIPKKK